MTGPGHNGHMSLHWMRRHPRLGDTAVAVFALLGCGLILTGATGARDLHTTPLNWMAVIVLPVPLIWRRRAPAAVMWSCVVASWTAAALHASTPGAFIVQLIALHALARYRPARQVWPAAAALVLPPMLTTKVTGVQAVLTFAVVVAITLTVALIGFNQRTRQAYLTALEERACRLEHERDQRARLAVIEERTRIAREMHDVVAHHLTVMTALSAGAAATVPADPVRAAGVMTEAAAIGRQALAEMRRLLGVLRTDSPGSQTGAPADVTAALEPQPGFQDIDSLVQRVSAAGLRVTLTATGTPGRCSSGAGLAAYRIVQEALTNTLKHAGRYAAAEVSLLYGPDHVEIDVSDDGAGRRVTRPALSSPGHGLTGMRERAAFYAGRLDAGPRIDGAGWQVRARLSFDGLALGKPVSDESSTSGVEPAGMTVTRTG
jgi:signal transduction histidine kinase